MQQCLHRILSYLLMAVLSLESQIKRIRDDIKSKTLSPIYLLKGTESYYIDLVCAEFENELIDESARDFNQNILYGKDSTATQIISLCRQYPLMYDKKLVILKEAQLMEKGQWEKLKIYLDNPLASTVLVICFKAESFDIRCKNLIAKHDGVILNSDKLKDYQVPKWIVSYVNSKKFTINELDANMLYEYLGNDLQKIANEIGKMTLNIKGRTLITKNDINEFIGISKDYNVIELQNALGRKDTFQANNIINYFAQNPKVNPIERILPILFSYFTKLLIASQVTIRNADTIAATLNFKSPYAAREYLTALNYYSTKQLLSIISLFSEYDLKSKGIGASSMMTDAEILKELVFKILHI